MKTKKVLKYDHGGKYMKHLFLIFAELECFLEKISFSLEFLFEKISPYHNNFEKLSTTKINKHTPSGCSMFTHCSFDATKNNLDCYRGKDCVERFCKDLKEHKIKVISFEKKK